jgi:hypothetical protein
MKNKVLIGCLIDFFKKYDIFKHGSASGSEIFYTVTSGSEKSHFELKHSNTVTQNIFCEERTVVAHLNFPPRK